MPISRTLAYTKNLNQSQRAAPILNGKHGRVLKNSKQVLAKRKRIKTICNGSAHSQLHPVPMIYKTVMPVSQFNIKHEIRSRAS